MTRIALALQALAALGFGVTTYATGDTQTAVLWAIVFVIVSLDITVNMVLTELREARHERRRATKVTP